MEISISSDGYFYDRKCISIHSRGPGSGTGIFLFHFILLMCKIVFLSFLNDFLNIDTYVPIIQVTSALLDTLIVRKDNGTVK